jgi:hypothetical protein
VIERVIGRSFELVYDARQKFLFVDDYPAKFLPAIGSEAT